jgi:Tfp pilus assembly protein PilN
MIVHFNLATEPLETHRRLWVFSWGAGTLAALLFVILGYHVYSVRKLNENFRVQRANLSAEIQRLGEQRQQLDGFFSRRENSELHARALFVNNIIDARSFNWTRMFVDLEKVLPGGVRVLDIEPSQVNGQAAVKLTVGAVSEEAKTEFLKSLEGSGVFSHLSLTAVRAPTQEGNGDKVVLELTVIYTRA